MIVICFPKVCIKKVLETSCIVLDSSGKAREVANNLLVPVAPTPGSEVLVLAGEKFCMCFVVGVSTISKKKGAYLGSTGTLASVGKGGEAQIKFATHVAEIPFSFLCSFTK